ncbi:hypothetical protein V5F40_21615 [Xanthobacter sp. DSM 14520]|uniref:hypothetical protein n=1 Tax=Xanthobacter autotrophicus (strain ATCC BAA-1158 / Py2) TaxID=78245 RepID=UPI00372782A6
MNTIDYIPASPGRWRSVLNGRFWCRDDVLDERRFFIQISQLEADLWLFHVSEFADGADPVLLNEGTSASLSEAQELADLAVILAASSNAALPRTRAAFGGCSRVSIPLVCA